MKEEKITSVNVHQTEILLENGTTLLLTPAVLSVVRKGPGIGDGKENYEVKFIMHTSIVS